MKICVFTTTLAGGGAEKVALSLERCYAERNHQTILMLVEKTGPLASQLREGINVVTLGSSSVLRNSWKLAKFIDSEKPDLIISTLKGASIVVGMSRFFSKTDVYSIGLEQSLLAARKGIRNRIRFEIIKIWMKLAYRNIDALMCVSKDVLARLYAHKVRKDIQQNFVWGNPVDIDHFSRPSRSTQPTHRWLDDDNFQTVIGAGRLTAQKDFGSLIKAFAIVETQLPRARLIILGEGPERNYLEELVKTLGLEKKVDLPGFVVDTAPFFQKASVFCLTSVDEGFGNVIVEAMAAGVEVVCTDCPGGPREILEYGKYGLLVPVGDIVSISNAIQDVLTAKTSFPAAIHRAQIYALPTLAEKYLELRNRRIQ